MHSPHLELARKFWAALVQEGDIAIDATCGRGRDTLFLCQLGYSVYGLDLQKEAIEETETLLKEHGAQAQLFHASHETFPSLLSPPRLIVYNLGYLPGGNKEMTTMRETTLISVAAALNLVGEGGAVSITCYPGHPEGALEEKALLEMVSRLPSQKWLVSYHQWPNRLRAPSLLYLERARKTDSPTQEHPKEMSGLKAP